MAERPASPTQSVTGTELPDHIVVTGFDTRAEAKALADARINAELAASSEAKGLKARARDFARKAWLGNVDRMRRRQEYIHRVEEVMTRVGYGVQYDASAESLSSRRFARRQGEFWVEEGYDWEAEKRAVVERFVDEFNRSEDDKKDDKYDYGSYLRQGEQEAEKLGGTVEAQMRKVVTQLVEDFVTGEIDDNTFEEAKNRRLAELANSSQEFRELVGEGNVFADNILVIAKAAAARVKQDEGNEAILRATLDEIAQKIAIAGQAKLGVDSEIQETRTAQLIEIIAKKTKNNPLVRLDEASISLALATVAGITGLAGRSVIGSVTRVGLVGAGAGLLAARREKMFVNQERALLRREQAKGLDVHVEATEEDPETRRGRFARRMGRAAAMSSAGVRRADLLKTLYSEQAEGGENETEQTEEGFELRRANDVLLDFASFQDKNGEFEVTSLETFDNLMRQLMGAKIYTDRAHEKGRDMLIYEPGSVEAQRTELQRMVAKSRSALRKYYDAADGDERDRLWADLVMTASTDVVPEDMTFNDLLNSYRDVTQYDFDEFIAVTDEEKEKAFKKVRRQRMIGRGLTAVAFGAAVGAVAQDVVANVQSGRLGLGEHTFGVNGADGDKQSVLMHTLGGSQHEQATGHFTPGKYDATDFVHYSHGGSVNITDVGDNSVLVETADGAISKEFTLENGLFSESDANFLKANGIEVSSPDVTAVQPAEAVPETMSTHDFVANQQETGKMTDVHRNFWADNNTSRADLNELRLDLRYNPETGEFSYYNGRMVEGESFHGSQTVSSYDQVVALSASRDTQGSVAVLEFDSNGYATIPADSPLSQMFSLDANGNPRFNGAFAEAGQAISNSDGSVTMDVAATDVGTNSMQQFNVNVTPPVADDVTIRLDYAMPSNSVDMQTLDLPIAAVTARGGIGQSQRRQEGVSIMDRGLGFTGKPRNNETDEERAERQRQADQKWRDLYGTPEPPEPEEDAGLPVDQSGTEGASYTERHQNLSDEARKRVIPVEYNLTRGIGYRFVDGTRSDAERLLSDVVREGEEYVVYGLDKNGDRIPRARSRYKSLDAVLDKFARGDYVNEGERQSIVGSASNVINDAIKGSADETREFHVVPPSKDGSGRHIGGVDDRVWNTLTKRGRGGENRASTPDDLFRKGSGTTIIRVADGREYTLPPVAVIRSQQGSFVPVENAAETAATASTGQQAASSQPPITPLSDDGSVNPAGTAASGIAANLTAQLRRAPRFATDLGGVKAGDVLIVPSTGPDEPEIELTVEQVGRNGRFMFEERPEKTYGRSELERSGVTIRQ